MFTRENAALAPNTSVYYDLNANKSPFIIVAYGVPKEDGSLNYHTYRLVSSSRVNFDKSKTSSTSAVSSTSGMTVVTTTVGTTQQSNQGSSSEGSLRAGPFAITWQKRQADFVDFSVSAQLSASGNCYVAIGFSQDNLMGFDDILACVYATSLKSIRRYLSVGRAVNAISNNNGISNATISLSDGRLTCTFRRAIKLADDSSFFDLNNQYFLLAAHGSTSDSGDINYHGSNKIASTGQIDFNRASTNDGSTSDNTKAKVHGKSKFYIQIFF